MQDGKDIKHGSSVPGRSFQSLPEDRTISIALSNEHNLENQGQEMGFKKESSGKLGTHQMMTESQPPAISETIVEFAADRIPKNRPSLLLDGIVGSFTNALLSSSIVPAEKSVWRKSALVAEAARASIVVPSLLGPKQCSAIVVNYISAGYILLPFGKSPKIF